MFNFSDDSLKHDAVKPLSLVRKRLRYATAGGVGEWQLNFSQYHFYNNRERTNVLNRLISIEDLAKDALADPTLKSLLIRVIQTQNMAPVEKSVPDDSRFIFSTSSDTGSVVG